VAIWRFEPSSQLPCTQRRKVKRRAAGSTRFENHPTRGAQPRTQGVWVSCSRLSTLAGESSRALSCRLRAWPYLSFLIDGMLQCDRCSQTGFSFWQLAAHHQVGLITSQDHPVSPIRRSCSMMFVRGGHSPPRGRRPGTWRTNQLQQLQGLAPAAGRRARASRYRHENRRRWQFDIKGDVDGSRCVRWRARSRNLAAAPGHVPPQMSVTVARWCALTQTFTLRGAPASADASCTRFSAGALGCWWH